MALAAKLKVSNPLPKGSKYNLAHSLRNIGSEILGDEVICVLHDNKDYHGNKLSNEIIEEVTIVVKLAIVIEEKVRETLERKLEEAMRIALKKIKKEEIKIKIIMVEKYGRLIMS